jgi:hypothetical protein
MQLEVIEKELHYYAAEIPLYRTKRSSPILCVWHGTGATISNKPAAYGIKCEYSMHLPCTSNPREDIGKAFDFYYKEMNDNLEAQVQCVIKQLADIADKMIKGKENFVRVVHFIHLHPVIELAEDGWLARRVSSFVAEVY